MSTDDLVARLQAVLADLDGYIERRAAELAAPLIAEAEQHAADRIVTARLETQRQEDLAGELRRCLRALERNAKTGPLHTP